MAELEIDVDEGILLESNEARLVSDGNKSINRLVLTNKNLHIVTKRKTGLFSSEQQVRSIPLESIKNVNGKPLIELKDANEYRNCLQIQSVNGTDVICFDNFPRRTATTWIAEIYGLLGMEYASEPTVADSVISGITGIAAGFKQAFGNAVQNAPIAAKEVIATAMPKPEGTSNSGGVVEAMPSQTPISNNISCKNCGSTISANSKFCPECGQANTETPNYPPPTTQPIQPIEQKQPDSSQRKIEYQGVVHKCPNCGGIVDPYDAVCDSCGYRISGRAANATVQEFNRQLMAIEGSRKRRFFNSALLDVADRQIISLINTFPIPNNVTELMEFMFMSASNINPRYSKKSIFSSVDSNTAEAAISNAWLAKMEQVYKKAKMSFSDDPMFEQIQETYVQKMRELKRL